MTKCNKCILPDSYQGIFFNNEGVCNYCMKYKPYHKYLGKDKLIELLNAKKTKRKYNCVVPLSGGKDSTYILYYAVKNLNLRPIAVTYDSGFQTDIAKENIKNACNILGVPSIVKKSPGDIQIKLLRESLLISKKTGYLRQYCGNCEAILRIIAINTAKKFKAPFILWGSSSLESLHNEYYEHYRHPSKNKISKYSKFLKTTIHRFKVLLRTPQRIRNIPRRIYPYIGFHSMKYKVFSIIQRIQMDFSIKYALRPNSIPKFTKNPMFVHFFDYISWDSIENINILKNGLKWKNPKNKESRFDCLIHSFDNLRYLKEFGISSDGINLCNFIRENRISREKAMAIEEYNINSIESECEEIIKNIGLRNYKLP